MLENTFPEVSPVDPSPSPLQRSFCKDTLPCSELMAGFHGTHQPSVYHQTEDDRLWPSVKDEFEPEQFDLDTMSRLALANNNLLMWDDAAPSPSSIMSQSVCNTDPMDGLAEFVVGNETQSIFGPPSFHHHQEPQWHVQDHDLAWQGLDHYYSNNAYVQAYEVALQNIPPFAQHQLMPTHNYNHTCMPPTSDPDQTGGLPVGIPLPDVFASTQTPYQHPPTPPASTPLEACPQRKSKRCSDDLYTPRWVRNAGPSREGWCGWCGTWFTLRDSAYWYHMHYSHGISQANNGKRLPAPAGFRAFGVVQPVEWEVKCGKCARWLPLPPGDKWNTAYFRHTYKCYFKAVGAGARADRSGPSSPMKSPSRRVLDML